MLKDIYIDNYLSLKKLQKLNESEFINIKDYNNLNFTCQDRTPFVYYLGWSINDKHYIGSRYGKGVLPSSLLTTYFTSSSKVKEQLELFGEPDKIIILKVFDNEIDTREYECNLLKYFNAAENELFLNQHNGNRNFSSPTWTAESRLKASISRKKSNKILCVHCNNYFYPSNYSQFHGDKCFVFTGIHHETKQLQTPETIEKKKNTFKNNPSPKILCIHCNNYFHPSPYSQFHGDKCFVFTGIKTKHASHSNETKLKISQSALNRTKTLCIYCNKEFDDGNYKQYHGENCKLNPNSTLSKFLCVYCNAEVDKSTYNRWHGDKCKLNPNKI